MIVTAELQTFERKTFRVQAIRVMRSNLREIAQWTGGEYKVPERGAPYVIIPAGEKKENQRAYIGDWVTSLIGDGKNFRTYKQATFLQIFNHIMNEAEKFAKVHEMLLKLALAQDAATYHGDTSGEMVLLVEKTAREICAIV